LERSVCGVVDTASISQDALVAEWKGVLLGFDHDLAAFQSLYANVDDRRDHQVQQFAHIRYIRTAPSYARE
jgi:hypothetical protein